MTLPPPRRYRIPDPPADPPGVPARRAALRLLDAVLRRGLPLEAALGRATEALEASADRALAHALAAEVLRRLPDLDALIDGATKQRLPEDAKARFALRIALTQALVLGTPPHAAIATVLPLVDGGPRRLVHGVFGTIARGKATLPDPPRLPGPVAARWGAAWGEAMVDAAAHALAAPPPLDLTLADPARTAALAGATGGVSLLPGHVRVAAQVVPDLPGYAEGAWWVQDIAASLPARLLGGGAGTALDLCAAPGGKTLQLASAGWRVTAVDSSPARLARLRENVARCGQEVEIVAADLRGWAPSAPADAVLLDAPCSATGIFRRHPDVLHRIGSAAIAERAALQAELLARAADWVRPGGRLIYATCSLEPEEGEAQLARFLAARADYAVAPVTPDELPAGIAPARDGTLRVLPGMVAPGGNDGFFVARLVRRG